MDDPPGSHDVAQALAALVALERRLQDRGAQDDIPTLRTVIDAIDDLLLRAVAMRAGVAKRLGPIKSARGQNVYVPAREHQVVDRWRAFAAELGLDDQGIEAIARAIIRLCREAQEPGPRSLASVNLPEGPATLVAREGKLAVRTHDGAESAVVGACLSFTSRCNERCIMCMEERDPNEGFNMPLDDALHLAGLFAGAVEVVNSSASEALLYRHFFEFARFVRDRGSRVGVVTNGLALARREFLDRCVEAGLRQVMVSCHTGNADTFGLLTGVPKGFPLFVRALDNLDDHNRHADPSRTIDVIVEVVVMRPLLHELDDLFAFIDTHLRSSRPVVRIETMRMLNSARSQPALQPTIDELAAFVRGMLERHAADRALTTRFVPLCLLPGHEHLASEVGQVLRSEKTLGNAHCHATQLVEVMRPESALSQPSWSHVCGACPLARVCPGVYDIPVPPGSKLPRRSEATLEDVASRLSPPIGPAELAAFLASLADAPQAGVAPRFEDRDLAKLEPMLAKLRAAGASVSTTVERVHLDVSDDQQPSGTLRLILMPAGADLPHYKKIEGVQVTYVGSQTPRLHGLIRMLVRTLGG